MEDNENVVDDWVNIGTAESTLLVLMKRDRERDRERGGVDLFSSHNNKRRNRPRVTAEKATHTQEKKKRAILLCVSDTRVVWIVLRFDFPFSLWYQQ